MKQKEILQFYEKIVPETCNENNKSPTPTKFSNRGPKCTKEKSNHGKFLRQKGIKKQYKKCKKY